MDLTISTGVTHVTGEDAHRFLQSLLSNDMELLIDGSSQLSLMMNASGKIISPMIVYRETGKSYFLVSEPFARDELHAMLQRLCIRTKAIIENVSDRYFGHVSESSPQGILIDKGHLGVEGTSLYLVQGSLLRDDRETYENFRISHDAVNVESDLGRHAIAQEAHLDRTSVSFTKGCFIGQELVCRIDSRSATTPFSYWGLTSSTPLAAGAELKLDDIVVGTVTSVGDDGLKGIAKIRRKGLDHIGEHPELGYRPTRGYFSC